MKASTLCRATAAAGLLLLTAGIAVAAFTIPADVLDAGGDSRSSTNYRLLDAIGQPSPAGPSTSTNFINEGGFLGSLIGTGRLLPSIGVTPPGLTFTTVVGISPLPQPLSITNTGGSTLAWNLSKTAPWLTLTPSFGSGDGASQVGVNAVGLTAGRYSDTVYVAGEGADNTPVGVPVSLTVKAGYTLTVQFGGTGGGTVTVTPPGTACNVNCGVDVPPPGATAAIHAVPDQYSITGTMSGACTGTTDCQAVMNTDKTELVTFTRDTAHVARVQQQVVPGNPTAGYYTNLQGAFDGAASGNTVQAWGVEFVETSVVVGRVAAKTVTIRGGYNAPYITNASQYSVLKGALTVRAGGLTVENLTIR